VAATDILIVELGARLLQLLLELLELQRLLCSLCGRADPSGKVNRALKGNRAEAEGRKILASERSRRMASRCCWFSASREAMRSLVCT
jgi:hypothetical protein